MTPRSPFAPRRGQAAGPDWPARFEQRAGQTGNALLKSFYGHGTVAGDTPLEDVPFVALDLETTGLRAETHSIVSIGLVPFTLARIHCARARYWVLQPRRSLSRASVAIHRLTHQDLEHAPDLIEVLPLLLQALRRRVAVVHYRGIERPFLERAVRDRLGEGLEFPVVDTMDLEARVHRQGGRGYFSRLWARVSGKQPVSLRLAQSRQRYGLPRYGAHHALTDALASAELLQAQVAWRASPDLPIRAIWR
ncbi:MAG: 3'-5' exonuclease [Xanthomonadaceae bacterium]|nr:3'-5' exonuclease [Xanthomonadaceae bacterium]